MDKEFIIVCCSKEDFKAKYKKAEAVEIINYYDIINKLESNDVFKEKPTDFIVQSYVMKKILRSVQSKKVERIFYLMDKYSDDRFEYLKAKVLEYNDKANISLA